MRKVCFALLAIFVITYPSIAFCDGWVDPVDYTWTGGVWLTGGNHLGIDWGNSITTEVRAIAKAYDVQLLWSGGFGGCDGTSGWALFLKHRKSDGTYFWALYGHVQNAVSSLPINAGQKVAEIAQYDPCYRSSCGCCSPGCPHLHFGVWNAGGFPTTPYGYGTTRSWTNPVTFMSTYSPAATGFAVTYNSQNPNTLFWTKPGNIHNFWVKYTNTGTATWENTGSVDNNNYVELWSCNSGGSIVNSWFEPVGWTNRQRVTTCDESTVAPSGVATFSFQGEIPATSSQNVNVYFRPTHGGVVMENWGGMHFVIQVDANPPSIPSGVTASPSSNNANSFAFSWSASSDAHSGVNGYYWKVNSGSETFTTGLSVSAGAHATQSGTNTFYVRCKDDVGNYSSYATTTFSYDPTGCGPPMTSCGSVSAKWTNSGSPTAASNDDLILRLEQKTVNDWASASQDLTGLIEPDRSYRIGYWYKTSQPVILGWGMTESGELKEILKWPGTVLKNPTNDNEWHQFWSAPFEASEDDLMNYSKMILFLESGTIGEVEISNVALYLSK